MAETSGFDINALLQNPLFLGGISGLLAAPNDRAAALLGGIRTGSQLQTADQERKLNALKLQALQAQQNFDPSQYMQTAPVAQGSAAPNAFANQVANQMPATLGGPIGGQTQMPPQTQMQPSVSPEPGTPTGRVDMQGLLSGGMQAGMSPAAIQQIAGIMDPATAAQQAVQAKLAEPYTLGPGQSRMVGGTVIGQNGNAPPNQTMIAIQQAKAARDAAQPGSSEFQMYDQLIKKLSGQQEAEQSQRNFDATQAQRDTNNELRLQGRTQQNDQFIQNKTNQFSNQLQKIGVPQAQQQLDTIDGILAKNKDSNDKTPGYGTYEGAVPSVFLSQDAKDLRQSVQSLANVVLKMRSGAAVTEPEQKRFITELGTGAWMPEASLLKGLKLMRGLVESEKRNAAAGVSNDVLDSYSSSPGAMDFSPYKKAGGGGGVSINNATPDDIDAAIARKMGK